MTSRRCIEQVRDVLYQVALEGTCIRGSKHACAITYKNRIIAIGVNKLKTHPIMLIYGKNKNAIFLHAEMDAIVKVINSHGPDILKSCALHVMRLPQGNVLGGSKPCVGCQRALDAFMLKEVYYS